MEAVKGTECLIINRRTQKALQVVGLDDGTSVCQAEITKSDAQIWVCVQNGSGVKIVNKAAKKVLDVMLEGHENGTWVQIWKDVDSETQLWKVTGRTYKKITHLASGKVLDIEGMLDEEGAHAQIWEDLDGENQQWRLEPLIAKTVTKTAKKSTVTKTGTYAKAATAPKKADTKKAPAKKTAAKAHKAPAKKPAEIQK